MQVTILRQPILRFAVHEDGSWEIVSPWFPVVGFPVELLGRVDGRRLEVQGDTLYLHCTNGHAAYTLEPAHAGVRRGRLAWSRG